MNIFALRNYTNDGIILGSHPVCEIVLSYRVRILSYETMKRLYTLGSAYMKINTCMLNWGGWGEQSIILSVKLYIQKLLKSLSPVFVVFTY